MKFHEFSTAIQALESQSGRNQMTEAMAGLLKSLRPDEIKPAMYLLQGRVAPRYLPIEFNFSSKQLLKVLAARTDEAELDVNPTELLGARGDEGLVAEDIRAQLQTKKTAKDKGLDIMEVFAVLLKLATTTGAGSQEAKATMFSELFTQLDPLSTRYLGRIVVGNLRLGLSDKTILDSLSWAIAGDKSWRERIERAYGARADLGQIAEIVLTTDVEKLEPALAEIKVTVGTPIAVKLVERESSPATTWARMQESLVQPKLDGMRAQVHFMRGKKTALDAEEAVLDAESFTGGAIFSRGMESLTDQLPEVLSAVEKLKIDSIIFDSEVIAYDSENAVFLPFQDTVQRRRKHGVEEVSASIPVRAMAFDILYLNGEDLTRKPLSERIEILRKLIDPEGEVICLLETKTVHDETELTDFFTAKVMAGLEGIIVKNLQSTYDPGTRNFDWIKLKANTQSELVDTVDVVVLGYFYGQGERSKYGFGSLLTGVYDPDQDKFLSVAKVGSGFTDALAPQVLADLQAARATEKPDNVVVEKILIPDVWVRPEIVMEVTADEITRSPAHTAARNLPASFEQSTEARGLSLRFPRLKVWKRDKQATQTTTPAELKRLFELRRQRLLGAA